MVDDESPRREDADYRIVERKSTYLFEDKRTNHRHIFTDVVVNGFKNNVFLRHLSIHERRNDHSASSGNRIAILDKESLPQWAIDEFESIDKNGALTPATDPR